MSETSASQLTESSHLLSWGEPPWKVDSQAQPRPLPDQVDVAIVGGGFTGLAAAAWLRRLAPEASVVVLEGWQVGSGASGRTGGMVLAETAAGDLPGLGNVLAGFKGIVETLGISCDLSLAGAWEIGRGNRRSSSPISWSDSGTLKVLGEVPGGTVDPGKLVSGLARLAQSSGALICEHTPVLAVTFEDAIKLETPQGQLRARQLLLATNAYSLELAELERYAQSRFTLAVATAPLEQSRLQAIGLAQGKPFYTVDTPYLWGRLRSNHSVVFGSGLVHANHSQELLSIDISRGQAAQLLASLEGRVRGLDPALSGVEFTHRWGGPILIPPFLRPIFSTHPRSPQALTLGGYSGHGVALSVYLGSWAAEGLLGLRKLPPWGTFPR